MKYLNAEHIT